ncbi:fimbrial protein [Serratia marcescens]|nr:fimbrial protein [Serratia marcescens]
MKPKLQISLFIILSGLLPVVPSLAVEDVAINLHGGLIAPPPCVINDGGKIDVDFGERVGVNKVDGQNYREKINYNVTCQPNVHSWLMTLTLQGNTAFDKTAIQTNNVSLGIKIYQNGLSFDVNSRIKIIPDALPVLEAVPIKKPGVELLAGEFIAVASLRAEYF